MILEMNNEAKRFPDQTGIKLRWLEVPLERCGITNHWRQNKLFTKLELEKLALGFQLLKIQ